MSNRFWVTLVLISSSAFAAETTVLPKHAFMLDLSYIYSNLDTRWSDSREASPLMDPVVRYEPGGGLQGVITARPIVNVEIIPIQLMYGVTDNLTVALSVPINRQTTITTNMGWTVGDYQPQIGRPYSEDDFWQWAESMGQPKPANNWVGNKGILGDSVAVARYRLPYQWLTERTGITAATALHLALPTGNNLTTEELVTVGTNAWELHAFGDVEAHLALSRPLWTDGEGLERVVVGTDLYYAFFRPRVYETPRGLNNPLLQTFQPYVGDTFVIDPGDWWVGSLSLDLAPIAGPTRATIVSGHSLERARELPPLLSLSLSYTYVATMQSDWQSSSEIWNYEREKLWLPGDKHVFRASATISLLRLGVPVMIHGSYRALDVVPGRNTRAANALQVGVRALAKFW